MNQELKRLKDKYGTLANFSKLSGASVAMIKKAAESDLQRLSLYEEEAERNRIYTRAELKKIAEAKFSSYADLTRAINQYLPDCKEARIRHYLVDKKEIRRGCGTYAALAKVLLA